MEPFGFFAGLVSGAAIGACGGYINHLFVMRRDKNNRFRSECLEFKIAFTPTLAKFQHPRDDSTPVAIVLADSFEGHLLAYVRFSFATPHCCKAGLGDAWKQYEQYYHAHRHHQTNQWLGQGGPEYECEQRRVVLEHINRLLDFAKDT